MIINDNSGMMWEGAVVAYFKTLSYLFSEGIKVKGKVVSVLN
jgi:hypothetical protein